MKEGLAHFTDVYLTSIGLIIFFLFFLGVLWWTSKSGSKELYRRVQNFPFENGAPHE
jgi:cbb3-type cytochrome oxidase subunit 3